MRLHPSPPGTGLPRCRKTRTSSGVNDPPLERIPRLNFFSQPSQPSLLCSRTRGHLRGVQHRRAPRLQRSRGRPTRARRPRRSQGHRPDQRRVRRRMRAAASCGGPLPRRRPSSSPPRRARRRRGVLRAAAASAAALAARAAVFARAAARNLPVGAAWAAEWAAYAATRDALGVRVSKTERNKKPPFVGPADAVRDWRGVHRRRVRGDGAVQGGSVDRRAGGDPHDPEQGVVVRVVRGRSRRLQIARLQSKSPTRGSRGAGAAEGGERGGRDEARARGGTRDGDAAEEVARDSEDQARRVEAAGRLCSPQRRPRSRLRALRFFNESQKRRLPM